MTRVPLLCAMFLAATGAANDAPEPEPFLHVTRQPYVQSVTHQSAVIVWRTKGHIEPVVHFGTEPNRLDRVARGDAVRMAHSSWRDYFPPEGHFVNWYDIRTGRHARGPQVFASGGTYQYEATLRDLTPDTAYYYAVHDGAKRIAGDATHRFHTAPKPGAPRPVRFWVVGESGSGGLAQAQVLAAMQKHVGGENQQPLGFILHTGGMVAGGSYYARLDRGHFDPYATLLRRVPCWPVMGPRILDRDFRDSFVLPTKGEAGGIPSGTEDYYAFDFGALHVVCLRAHGVDFGQDSVALKWLKDDLGRAKGDGPTRWIVAVVSHSPFAEIRRGRTVLPNAVREHIMPVLEARGVDLVLAGGERCYMRSGQLALGKPGEPRTRPPGEAAEYRKGRGAVLLVVGNGGLPLGKPDPVPQAMERVVVEHGSLLVDVRGDTLTGVMLDKAGALRDRFAIAKRAD